MNAAEPDPRLALAFTRAIERLAPTAENRERMLVEMAREWADGAASAGIKGDTREMALANTFTVLADQIEKLVHERDEIAGRLSGFLDEVTGGTLSKPTYDVPTMVESVEEWIKRRAQYEEDEA